MEIVMKDIWLGMKVEKAGDDKYIVGREIVGKAKHILRFHGVKKSNTVMCKYYQLEHF